MSALSKITATLFFLTAGIVAQAQQAGITPQQAVSQMKYSNALISLHNAYQQSFQSYANTIKTAADENMYKLKRNMKTRAYFVDCDRSALPVDDEKAYRATAKVVPAVPEKEALAKWSAAAFYWFDRTGMWCSRMSSYFTEEKYKQDTTFASYLVLRDSMVNAIDQGQIAWRKTSALATQVGDRAELVLLAKSKLAMYVVPMKKDLIQLQRAMDGFEQPETDAQALRTQLNDLKASVDKNANTKTIDFSKLSDAYYREVYTDFYRNCSYCVSVLLELLDKKLANEPKTRIDQGYNLVKASYNRAVDQYNTFIKQ